MKKQKGHLIKTVKPDSIAEEMGISETTVKFHKSVAYRELNKSLGHLFLMITMLS